MSWDSGLKSLDYAALPMLFEGQSAAARNIAIGLPADLKYARRAAKRQTLDLLRTANAAKHLERLPEPGESFHVISKGNFALWDIVPAILQLAAPATIADLRMATLGFSRANIQALVELFDAKEIGRISFICSSFFRSVDKDAFAFVHEALTTRGQRVASIRCHAKVILAEMSDGRYFAVESSANLRSCHNVEFIVLHHDRDLHAFHRDWMDTLLKGVSNARP